MVPRRKRAELSLLVEDPLREQDELPAAAGPVTQRPDDTEGADTQEERRAPHQPPPADERQPQTADAEADAGGDLSDNPAAGVRQGHTGAADAVVLHRGKPRRDETVQVGERGG